MKNVTLRQARIFSEAARALSFVRAAEILHLTPPAVTLQIKELEAAVGLPLFDRHGRQISLTTAGEYYLVYARRLLATVKEAEDAMARLRRLESGLLTVGMVSTAKYFVPFMISGFSKLYPNVDVSLSIGNRQEIGTALRGYDLDFAIMGRPPKELATRTEPFAAHPHVFIAPPDHPLLGLDTVPVSALETQAFIIREAASGTRAAMNAFFAEHSFQPRSVMEMPSNESIKQAVMAGMGLSFLSLHTLWLELKSGLMHVLPVEGSPVVRIWNIVRLAPRTLSPAADAFREFILREGEPFLLEHDRPWIS